MFFKNFSLTVELSERINESEQRSWCENQK